MTIGVQIFAVLRTIFTRAFRGDHFKFPAPTFVIFLSFSNVAFADFDLQIGSSVRSYPLSGVVEINTGYGWVLYGEETKPFSGYVRTKVDMATALSFNAIGAALEIFPLAILGVRGGGEIFRNAKEYTPYDCDLYDCMGNFNRTYIEAEATAGAGPVFLQGKWRRERWGQENKDGKNFVDPTSGIPIIANGDSETVYTGILGYKLNDSWSLLGIYRYAESDHEVVGANGRASRFPALAVRYKAEQLTVGVGGGLFESALKEEGASAVGFIRYELAPSVTLK